MIFPVDIHHYFGYVTQKEVTRLYITVGIRNLALGMVFIFLPIYIYQHFHSHLPLTLLYFGVLFGLYGLLAPVGGKLLARIGGAKCMLMSAFLAILYQLSLLLIDLSVFFMLGSIVLAALEMALFWPVFHIEFTRLSSREKRGIESSRVNVAMLIPSIIAPAVGGFILYVFTFPVLFALVALVLLASTMPLFYARERVEVYTDSYTGAFHRIFKRKNAKSSIAVLSDSLEFATHLYVWPLFLFTLAIGFSEIGGIISFSLIASSLFMLYVGRISDTPERSWLLNVGSVMTSVSWILISFVRNPFEALLTKTIYRISRSAAIVPFWTSFYEMAASREAEADEFIVYRETLSGLGRLVFFSMLAAVFFVWPALPLQALFFIAAFVSLGFVFLGNFTLPFHLSRK